MLPAQRVGKRRERRFKPEHVDAASHRLSAPDSRRGFATQVMLGGRALEVPVHLAALYDSDAARVRLTAPSSGTESRPGSPAS